MPPVVVVILERSSMSCASHIATEFHTQRIRHGSEWPKRVITNYKSISITTEFCSGRYVLQIIFAMNLYKKKKVLQ